MFGRWSPFVVVRCAHHFCSRSTVAVVPYLLEISHMASCVHLMNIGVTHRREDCGEASTRTSSVASVTQVSPLRLRLFLNEDRLQPQTCRSRVSVNVSRSSVDNGDDAEVTEENMKVEQRCTCRVRRINPRRPSRYRHADGCLETVLRHTR